MQLFHLPCLCRKASYSWSRLGVSTPHCSLVVFWPIGSPGFVPVIPCLWKFMFCKVTSNNPLAAVLQLFWTTLRSQSLSHLVYSLKSKIEDKCSFLILCLWLQVVFSSNLKIFFSLLFLHLCQTCFSLACHPKAAVHRLCNPKDPHLSSTNSL